MSEIERTELTAEDARALTDEIRVRLAGLLPLIKEAFLRRADRALGYATWHDYCAAELDGVRIPVGDRPAAVAELRSAGMSTRAIGSALGTSEATVRRDLSTASNDAVDPPSRVVSLDGRERPAAHPHRQTNEAPSSDVPDDASAAEPLDERGLAGAIADAQRDARTAPAHLAHKAFETLKVFREHVTRNCGGVDAICDDLTGADASTRRQLWLAELDDTAALIDAWRERLRRQYLRRVQ